MLRFAVGDGVIELVLGDITSRNVVGDLDTIANAANAHLAGGGGVDGAVHRAAGPELARALAEVRTRLAAGVLAAGGAVVTPGFELPVGHVIHCVGPVYGHEGERAPALLRSAYVEALRICRRDGFRSVAFPAISTGAYGYPVDEAARVAWDAVRSFLAEHGGPSLVRFVLFDSKVLEVFTAIAKADIQAERSG